MFLETVQKIESALGRELPSDYRDFLVAHRERGLDPSLLVHHAEPVPGSGLENEISVLYTAANIFDSDLIGDPENKMIIIGLVEPGGYLYMCVSPADYGSVHIRFPYQDSTYHVVGRSFSDFMARCRPCPDEDA